MLQESTSPASLASDPSARPIQLLVVVATPRKEGNSEILADHLIEGFKAGGGQSVHKWRLSELRIKPCVGCLKCNATGLCATTDDDWPQFLRAFREAQAVVLSTPIYFRYVPGSLKTLLDRFRCQVHIQMTPTGLIHTPRFRRQRPYVYIFSLGDRSLQDAQPAINLFNDIFQMLGAREQDIHILAGLGLAARRQIQMSSDHLRRLYIKLGLPEALAEEDYRKNQHLLQQAFELGYNLAQRVAAASSKGTSGGR